MAGRPVAARGGGLTGLHYGLITFVILTVLALVLFVLQLTKNTDLVAQAKRSGDLANSYGSPPAYYEEEAKARNTKVFNALDDDRRMLATLVVGKPDSVGRSVEQEARGLLGEIGKVHNTDSKKLINDGDTLVTVVRRLSDSLVAARQAERTADERAKSLEGEKQALSEQTKQLDEAFKSKVDELSQQLAKAEEEKANTLAEKDKQLGDIQAASEAVTQELQQLRTEVVRGEREKDLTIARLEKQIDSLRGELATVKPSAFHAEKILTEGDGRVLRAIPGSEIVYINLGEKDRVKVGMGFEVYSQTRESQTNLRGKASLEVLTLMTDTAECKVTRQTPGQPVVENDYIVNIAYDKTHKPKFFVIGDFDLNYDGQVDFEGVEKIGALVRDWGGQTVDKLDESTDYVIIGMAPQVPSLSGEYVSGVVKALADDKEIEKSRFKELINEARSMYIPVVTQNAFLVLTGYSGTGSAEVR